MLQKGLASDVESGSTIQHHVTELAMVFIFFLSWFFINSFLARFFLSPIYRAMDAKTKVEFIVKYAIPPQSSSLPLIIPRDNFH